jgi:hypothetical protein
MYRTSIVNYDLTPLTKKVPIDDIISAVKAVRGES